LIDFESRTSSTFFFSLWATMTFSTSLALIGTSSTLGPDGAGLATGTDAAGIAVEAPAVVASGTVLASVVTNSSSN
jgi:hypothetical protein